MADKQISQLVAATTLNNEDLLVIQQGQIAKKLSGERLAMFVYSAAGSMIDEVNSAVEEAQAAVDELLEEKNAIAQTIADMAGLGTDTTLTTPAMAADSKAVGDRIADVEKDALAGLNQKTISDIAIASFDDGGDDAPVKELIVNIDPVQDLHGQDAPYPAGGGKNKFDIGTSASDYEDLNSVLTSINGNTLSLLIKTNSYTRIFRLQNQSLQGDITISYTASKRGSRLFVRLRKLDDSGWMSNNDASITGMSYLATFDGWYANSDGENLNVSKTITIPECLYWQFGIGYNNNFVTAGNTEAISKIQIKSGETATPWSPFANICPITGWTGCEVTRTGVNVFGGIALARKIKELVPSAVLDEEEKTITYTAQGITGKVLFTEFKPATQYTVIMTGSGPAANLCFQYSNSGLMNFSLNDYKTSASGHSLAEFKGQWATGTTVLEYEECGIFEGVVTADDFEPYSGTTLSVTFPVEAGTVYGARLNLTTGKLIVDTAARQFDGSGDVYSFVSNGRVNIDFAGIDYKKGLDKDSGISNSYAGLMQTANNTNFDSSAINYASCYNISSSANNFTVRIKDPRFVDLNTAQGILEEEPLVIIFNLNTPIVYNLTPIEVRTLLKINNIWANTGNINTLIYRTIPITEEVIREIMGNYEEIISGVEYTGKATKNYYAGNLVIVNDILYKCLVNVASGETFTPGAGGNVSQTTIADELATLQALYDNLGNLALLSYTTA